MAVNTSSKGPLVVKDRPDLVGPPIHEKVGFVLTYAVFGAPALWALQLVVNYAFSAHACFPNNVPLSFPIWDWVWWLVLGVDCLALIGSGLAGWAAVWKWNRYHDADMADVGARRNRYLASWAMLISALFFITTVFTIVMIFIEPVCDV